MKKLILLTLGLVFLYVVGCDQPITQPEGALVYHGIQVKEGPAPFILNVSKGVRAKGTSPDAELESSPSDGTVYGLQTDSTNVYLAQGGEQLPGGTWIDNAYGNVFTTTLFANSTLTFSGLQTVTLIDPVNTSYMDANNTWVPVSTTQTVTAQAVATGENGSTDVETTGPVGIGGGGDNN